MNNDDIQYRLLRTLRKEGLINLLKSRTEKLKQADALIREQERMLKSCDDLINKFRKDNELLTIQIKVSNNELKGIINELSEARKELQFIAANSHNDDLTRKANKAWQAISGIEMMIKI